MRSLFAVLSLGAAGLWSGCQPSAKGSPDVPVDYCAIEAEGARVELTRPGPGEPEIDDVNWFARPLPNERGDWIVGFASHNQNYLYNLSTGARIRIPDRSDAVATPDGRYVTVPSYYTPDENIRFYDAHVLLEHLERGEDADDVAPAFVHDHPDLHKVYYQSTGVVSTESSETVYRLMFSGTASESAFRIVDYRFWTDAHGAVQVEATEPMKLCPEIPNDLNTPFISKDARYVVSYTSTSEERAYSPGSSLKIFRIAETIPEAGTTRCEEVVDFGFAAGKADFSFDNEKLTFHISQGAYLTPFVNGGLDAPTITDVVVVDLTKDDAGNVTGYSNMARVTTSTAQGIGSYFPAFFRDGKLFYIFNAAPKNSAEDKTFHFKVVDPDAELSMSNVFADERRRELAATIGELWRSSCASEEETPLDAHEAPWLLGSLTRAQCDMLVEKRWTKAQPPKAALLETCALR